MLKIISTGAILALSCISTVSACERCGSYGTDDMAIESTQGSYDARINSFILEIEVTGEAGSTYPIENGQLDGAPVLGYVFPTSLKATDVGFSETDGIVALALTSHPDFDDTPLWDENVDGAYDNDGRVWHPHWVVLKSDDRVEGGLSVKQFNPESGVTLPPTNPGMPMYMDSPGYTIVTDDNTIRVVLPADRIRAQAFNFDAVTAFMRVNTSNEELPMLGVYKVYAVASGDLSLPYSVEK